MEQRRTHSGDARHRRRPQGRSTIFALLGLALLLATPCFAGDSFREMCAEKRTLTGNTPILARSMVALLASPESFFGCRVLTEGYFGDGFVLYLSARDYEDGASLNGLIVETTDGTLLETAEGQKALEGKRVRIRGLFGGSAPPLASGSLQEIDLLEVIEGRPGPPNRF